MYAHRRGHRVATFTALFVTLLTLLLYQVAFAQGLGIGQRSFALVPAPTFRTSLHIPAARNGLRGDGKTDNTKAFRALLGAGNRSIEIAPGTYITGNLVIPRNTVLLLDPGVVIKDSGKLGPGDRLINIADGNVYIQGRGAKILSDRQYYRGGEQRHGIFIYGASNVFIDGVESSDNSGDGFYVGGPTGKPAQNITLQNCIARNNRRQGLSITSAEHMKVVNCIFTHTQGTAPAYGVDLEPNQPSDVLEDIHLIGIQTAENYGGGILLALKRLNRSSPPINIEISGHTSVAENNPYTVLRPKDVRGTLTRNLSRSTVRPPRLRSVP